MRPGLLWLLGITLGLTAFVLWWPEPISESFRARVRMAESSTPSTSPLPVASLQAANGSPPSVDAALLPAELVRIELEPAKFDPFLGAQPPLKPQVLTARVEAPATRAAQPQFMPPEPSLPAAPPLRK